MAVAVTVHVLAVYVIVAFPVVVVPLLSTPAGLVIAAIAVLLDAHVPPFGAPVNVTDEPATKHKGIFPLIVGLLYKVVTPDIGQVPLLAACTLTKEHCAFEIVEFTSIVTPFVILELTFATIQK